MAKALAMAAVAVVLVAAVALAYLRYRMANTRDEGRLEAAIERELRKFTRHGLAGAVVVAAYKDGRSHVQGSGAATEGGGAPPDGDTVFQIASVSKVFTAALLQALCDEGLVTMDSTLQSLIGARWPLAPRVAGVTLRQLATHTAGFPSVPKALQAQADAAARAAGQDPLADPYSHVGPESVLRWLATAPDQAPPGAFVYSNFGMGLLGHVLEQATGRSYEDLVVDKVLAPLGMDDTRVAPTPRMRDRLATGHDAQGQPCGLWHFAALAGAGGLASSANDLLKFVRASLDADAPAAHALRAMGKPQCRGHTGIGWMQPTFIDRFVGNRGIVWHNGMVGGYAAYLSIDATSRSGTLVLVNRAVDVTMLGTMLTRQVRTQSWASPCHAGAAPDGGG